MDLINICLPFILNLLSNRMRKGFILLVSKTIMVLLVALSLLTIDFAHQPAMTDSDVAQADYLSGMGLTAADLCADPDEEGGRMAMGDCPACQLVASVLLPEAVGSLIDLELRASAVVIVPAEARIFGRRTNPATPVRAPPLA